MFKILYLNGETVEVKNAEAVRDNIYFNINEDEATAAGDWAASAVSGEKYNWSEHFTIEKL